MASNASKITLYKNPNPDMSDINKIDMTCDSELDVPYPLPPHHSAWLIVGKPGSGKTNLIMNLLNRENKYYHRKFNRIYFFSRSLHTISEALKLPRERVISTFDFPTLNRVLGELEEANKIFKVQKDDQPHNLIVLDDVVSSFRRDVDELQKMVFNRRHYHMTVMTVTQVYNKVPLELRKCCDTLVLFYSPHRKEVRNIWEEFLGHLSKEQIDTVWNFVFDKMHQFLFVRSDIVPASDGMFKNFDQIKLEPCINNSFIFL